MSKTKQQNEPTESQFLDLAFKVISKKATDRDCSQLDKLINADNSLFNRYRRLCKSVFLGAETFEIIQLVEKVESELKKQPKGAEASSESTSREKEKKASSIAPPVEVDFSVKETLAIAASAALAGGLTKAHGRDYPITKNSFPKLTDDCLKFISRTDFNNYFSENHRPLNNKKNKVNLKTMYTTLTNQGHGDLLNEILPNYQADKIDYRYFEKIQEFILKHIKLYVKNSDDDKLVKCFHSIQFWGGKMGKSIYVRPDGFNSNFDIKDYKRLFYLCKKPDKLEIIKYCESPQNRKIKQFGIPFITKHVKFFTKYFHGEENPELILPIFDRQICASMFGNVNNLESKISYYYEYLPRLCKIKECTPELFENVLFN